MSVILYEKLNCGFSGHVMLYIVTQCLISECMYMISTWLFALKYRGLIY